ncbi:MAG TPA: azurin, partial [Pseudomonas sp.]|nr:azurin [Pseudomonas sp.]
AGMNAGEAKGYLPEGDERIIAHTKMIGAPEKETEVTFDATKLAADGDYSFFCTFPGHISVMKGKVVVK